MRVKKYVVSMAVLLIVVGVMRGSDRFPSGARYLIIAPDAYYDALLPLAQWKTQKGMLAKIAKLSETGYSAAEIKAYIQNAYNNWDPPPEYVFLVGNGDSIPFTTVSGVRSDCYYGNMDGDIYDEIIIGRFPAYNVSEVENYVNKVLNYEKEPYTGNWNWFVKATQMVEVDYDDDDSIYWGDVMHAESLMYKAGFIHVDMFSDSAGNSASDVYAAIENGRSFINFRGQSVCHWWSPFDVDPYSTNPGLKLPVIVSPTCGQVSSDFTCGSEWVRAGTVSQPRGGVAFCGPTTVITGGAYKRSALDRGFFDYVFTDSGDSIVAFGKGVEAGRKRYYELYGDYSEFYGFQCIADPELNIWTGQPRNLAVSYPQAIPPGPYDLSVHVEDPDGDPVKYALVCAMKDTSVYAYGYTDDYGNVTLSIETQPTDTVLITVTARNKIPYEGYTVASATGPYVAYKRYVVVDGSYGNGDGYVNPGETTELLIWVENIGTDPSYGVNGTLSSSDPSVTIIQNYANYGDLSPDDSAASSPLYRFQVAEACTVGQEIPLTLLLHDSDNNSWTQTFNIVIYSPEFSFGGISILDSNGGDGDGIPEPGETVDLFVTVNNEGNLDAQSPYGILSTSDLYVTILRDSSNFSTIPAGGSNSNNLSYRVSISSSCPNSYEIPFTLTMTTSDGFTGDVEFSITVGTLHDDMENGQGSWEHYAYSNGYNDEWHLESYRNHTPGGSYSWKCGGYGSDYYSNYDDAALVTPEFYLPDSSHLIFWHWMEAETSNYYTGSCYDGGAVYISINGGPFEQITPEGGYPYTIIGGHGNALPDGTPVFSGSFGWTQADFDLTGYSGNARIMFRFASDQGVTLEGWYIDDVEIQTSHNPVPHIVVTPDEIDTSAYVGEVVIDTIFIQNTGDAVLNFTVETSTKGIAVKPINGFVGKDGSKQDWLEVSPDSGTVPPGETTLVQITLDATSLTQGLYSAHVYVHSNDPSDSLVSIPVLFDVYAVPSPQFIRGDANADGSVDVSDAVYFLDNLFPAPNFVCQDAADFDDNGELSVGDCSYFIDHFSPSPSFPPPNLTCGEDPTPDDLVCDSFPPCSRSIRGAKPLIHVRDTLYIGYDVSLKHSKSLSAFQIEVYGKIDNLSAERNEISQIKDFAVFRCVAGAEKYVIVGLKSFNARTNNFMLLPGTHRLFRLIYLGDVDSVRAFYVTETGEKIYPVVVGLNSGVTDDTHGGLTFRLFQSNPNPFSKFIDISFSIPFRMKYSIDIYDVTGRLVKSERFGEGTPGVKTYRWFGVDDYGRKVKSGIYFIKLKAGKFEAISRVILAE